MRLTTKELNDNNNNHLLSLNRLIAMISLLASIFGVSTVFLVLISSFMQDLIPTLSDCEWLLVAGVVVLPFTWLGTPKDLW